MKSKQTLLILTLLFVLLLGSAYVLYSRLTQDFHATQIAAQKQPAQSSTEDAQDSAEKPQPIQAPDFTVYDQSGNAVSLSDFFGKPIVLNFWASWCTPCKMEMPDFQEKYLALSSQVQFLMINMTDGSRETVFSASEFIAEQKYTFPVFYDTGSYAAMAYGAYSLPTTYFINAEGYAIAQAIGAIDGNTLQKGIDMISSTPIP